MSKLQCGPISWHNGEPYHPLSLVEPDNFLWLRTSGRRLMIQHTSYEVKIFVAPKGEEHEGYVIGLMTEPNTPCVICGRVPGPNSAAKMGIVGTLLTATIPIEKVREALQARGVVWQEKKCKSGNILIYMSEEERPNFPMDSRFGSYIPFTTSAEFDLYTGLTLQKVNPDRIP